jgi:citrate lyase subunit beta/citryl-CoA lyase
LLFVPGAEPRKVESARNSAADTLVLDLEDSVAFDQKANARMQVAAALRDMDFGDAELAVRVNPPGTPYFEDDLERVLQAGARTIMIPKCETAAGMLSVARRIERWERATKVAPNSVQLLALVETAAGIAQVLDVAGATARIGALCFGHADLALDMGLPDASTSNRLVLHARCTLAIAAKAHRVGAVDNVFLDVRDDTGFQEDVLLGMELGFEGKLCIHPRQVEIANRLHTPTPQQIEFATRVVEGWHRCQADGRGVFTIDNKMIDAPLVAAQQRILARAALAKA